MRLRRVLWSVLRAIPLTIGFTSFLIWTKGTFAELRRTQSLLSPVSFNLTDLTETQYKPGIFALVLITTLLGGYLAYF